MIAETMSAQAGLKPLNQAGFDRSGELVAVASEDAKVRVFDTKTGNQVTELSGHEESAQGVLFDTGGQFLVSSGGDGSFRIWQ